MKRKRYTEEQIAFTLARRSVGLGNGATDADGVQDSAGQRREQCFTARHGDRQLHFDDPLPIARPLVILRF